MEKNYIKNVALSILGCLRPKMDPDVIPVIATIVVCFLATMFMVAMNTYPAEAKTTDQIPVVSTTAEAIFPCEGRTVGTAVRFRERPNTSSIIFEEMKKNSGMTVFGEENGWYYVRRNNLYGYVKAEYVQLITYG